MHVACDGLGLPVRFLLTEGQAHDITQAPALIADFTAEHVLADKGYDSDAFTDLVTKQGAVPVIPPRENRKQPRDYDKVLYRERNRVERLLNRLKQCRRIATRYDKTARNFLAFLHLASTILWLV